MSALLAVPPGVAATSSEADLAPALVGLKRAVMVQVPPPATVVPLQPSVTTLNSVLARVVVTVPEGTPPVLLTVKVAAVPLWPATTSPKLFDVGAIASVAWLTPVPESGDGEIDVIVLMPREELRDVLARRRERLLAGQELERLPEIPHAVDVDALDHRGFARIGLGNDDGLPPLLAALRSRRAARL